MRILRSLAILASLVVPVAAFGSTITVVNGDFSTLPAGGLNNPDPIKGDYTNGVAPVGWNVAVGGTYGQYAPTGVIYTGYNGSNVIAWSGGPTITQTVGATVSAGVIYTLTVDLGNRTDVDLTAGVDLLINGSRYYGVGTAPGEGLFSTYTVTYLGTVADAGKAITIELTSSGSQANFDNVAMSDNLVTPEPSSIALLGTGILSLAGFARRRFRS